MTFDDIIDILDRSVGGPDAEVSSHGPFWRGVTRDRFVAMKVGGRPLITEGDGANSNLVKSLQGVAPFGSDLEPAPEGARIMRMPAYLDPVSDEDIDRVVAWIDAGGPET